MITPVQILQYVVDVLVLVIVAIAEYLKVVPGGTFYFILLFILGHIFGSVPTVTTLGNLASAINTNTTATVANTLSHSNIPVSQQPTQSMQSVNLPRGPTLGP